MRILGCVVALVVAWPIATAAAPINDLNTPNQADWEMKPSGDAVSAAFPPLALALGLEGSTALQCSVDRLGLLQDCNVVEVHAPRGMGFEAASLSLTPMFRLRPGRTSSGRGKNSVVRIPLAFRIPTLQGEFPAVVPDPAPAALPLAREQVARFMVGKQLDHGFEQADQMLAQSATPSVEAATRAEIMGDIRVAQLKVRAEVLEFQAHVLAAHLTQQQIQAGLDFDETSGARKMSKSGDAISRRGDRFMSDKAFWLLYSIHQDFCRTHDCKGSPGSGGGPSSPPWIQQPTQPQINAASPKLAMLMLVGGYADLDCGSTDFGVLMNCEVVQEKPTALGFGAAALSLSAYYRRPPGLRGERTSLRVAFPFPDIPKLDPPTTVKKESSKITLARQVVEAENRRVILGRQVAHMVEQIDHVDLPGVSDTTRQEALAVMQERLRIFVDDALAAEAEGYAEILTEAELKERLAYVSGPDYAALTAMNDKMAKSYQQLSEIIYARVSREAGRLYCVKHDCPKLPPYRGPRTAADPLPPFRP